MTPDAASSHPTPDTAALWGALVADLRRFVRGRVGDPAVADDIVQDVFVRVHEQRHTLREQDRVEAWVYRIARNAVTDHHRSHRPPSRLPEDGGIPAPPPDPHDDDAPERVLGAWLRLMIHALPPVYREALELTELQGISQREAARRLGLSYSGLKSRVQRGRAQLRQMLDRCCEVALDARGRVIDYRCRAPDECC